VVGAVHCHGPAGIAASHELLYKQNVCRVGSSPWTRAIVMMVGLGGMARGCG
jgi:hypothetical protein